MNRIDFFGKILNKLIKIKSQPANEVEIADFSLLKKNLNLR